MFMVATVVPGSPAAQERVSPGCLLMTVDGVDVEGLSSADVAGRIRGHPGEGVVRGGLSWRSLWRVTTCDCGERTARRAL